MPIAHQEQLASRARVRGAARALRHLFADRPAGLLTDVDGTISRITRRTNDATVASGARRALTRLCGELDLVAVVTGRAVERAVLMVGVPEASYVGNHGLEWLQNGVVVTDPAAEAARPALEAALHEVRAAVDASDLTVEDKRVSVAIHYRLSVDPPAVERKLLAAIEPFVASGTLRLIKGGLVVNLLPGLQIDKGEAVRRLVEQHRLRAVAFFGDDVTDLHAFRALHALRAAGTARTLAIGVGSVEGPPEVRAEADLVLEGVGEVERVLAALAARLPRGRTPAG
jgi:trehalose 6-phosphate phosphatase